MTHLKEPVKFWAAIHLTYHVYGVGGFVYILIVKAITKNKCKKTTLILSLGTGVEYPAA